MNKQKKPVNPGQARSVFYREQRDTVRQQLEARHPGEKIPESKVTQTLRDLWDTFDEEEKKPWEALAEEARAVYRAELKAWKEGLGVGLEPVAPEEIEAEAPPKVKLPPPTEVRQQVVENKPEPVAHPPPRAEVCLIPEPVFGGLYYKPPTLRDRLERLGLESMKYGMLLSSVGVALILGTSSF